MDLTAEQLRILRHMLGIDNGRNAVPYRNYYCANPGNRELHELQRQASFVFIGFVTGMSGSPVPIRESRRLVKA